MDQVIKKTGPTYEQALEAVNTLLQYIGEDPKRPGLVDTPGRFLRAWREEWGKGYHTSKPLMRMFPEPNRHYDEMVIVRDIAFHSHCEHHIAPFFGSFDIGYIPDERGIVGLSKLCSAAAFFSRRLQVQERLTEQVAEFLTAEVSKTGVGVVCRATHMCMVSRGVTQPNAQTITSALKGRFFADDKARAEFLRLLGKG
jgi:GTP cyclohydrolase I